ncbi:DNase I-like protein [Auricularia subglabra TFB-10046 SS5]|nr:DNase I-like protein [Auricularia subglabra TFB-10046 SS5]
MPPPPRPHLAPPPTRIIAPGAPLPARRTSPGGSSSDSEEDTELAPSPSSRTSHMPYRRKTLDDMPDSSTASRRPPVLHHAALHVPAHTGVVAVAGNTVLIASSTIRIFDLSNEDAVYADPSSPHTAPAPAIALEVRDLGLEWRSKEHRITAAEFRPALGEDEEEGRYAWLGTRDGHLLELDAWTGRVVDVRSAIHSGALAHILRGERELITVDENGKALRWAGERGKAGGGMLRQSARLVRLAERTGFVGALGGWLWAASAASAAPAGSNSNLSNTLKKGFSSSASVDSVSGTGGQWTLRAYDMRGSTPACSVLPTHDVGAVTCGATLQTQPGLVYLGHEGGVVSIWECNGSSDNGEGRAAPVCVQTLKIGAGDVLALQGVGARLWAGGRSGVISAYDVSVRPWRATNAWKAHGELPVLKMGVDVVGITKAGRVGVWSVGRDESVRFWDGLLGGEWIEDQLLQRERKFCSYRALRTLICTWNVDAARPDGLTGSPANVTFLESLLQSVESPDIIVFGFQELIDLEDRKLTAKNVLLGGNKKKADGTMSSKVSRSYKLWHDALVLAVRVAMPATCPYTVVHTENLVGLFTCIFVKSTEVAALRDVAVSTVKRGLGGRYGNKGAIAARFVIDDSSVCFVNCHLAAGQKHVKTRNADVAAILEDRTAFSPTDGVGEWGVSYVGGGDGSMVLDHEICFLNGDLNYRIDQRREAVVSYVRGGDYSFLLQHDQLLKELSGNPYFRLRVFREAAPIAFAPTYKYDRRSDNYDTSEKRRAPAWCDRVLVRARESERVRCLEDSYRRWEVDVSDHRPVSAAFEMTVKKVDWARRERERTDVLRDWDRVAGAMLREAREWYVEQGCIWLA